MALKKSYAKLVRHGKHKGERQKAAWKSLYEVAGGSDEDIGFLLKDLICLFSKLGIGIRLYLLCFL